MYGVYNIKWTRRSVLVHVRPHGFYRQHLQFYEIVSETWYCSLIKFWFRLISALELNTNISWIKPAACNVSTSAYFVSAVHSHRLRLNTPAQEINISMIPESAKLQSSKTPSGSANCGRGPDYPPSQTNKFSCLFPDAILTVTVRLSSMFLYN
jgi:hypothetical protein